LLSELRRRTTWPPLLFPSNVTVGNTNLIITPKVERDDGLPDLGYHYAPLDMVLGSVQFTNSSILITNGASVGTFTLSPDNYGIGLGNNARMFSEGSPTNLNYIVRYNCVQEQGNTNWGAYVGPSIALTPVSAINAPQARFRFTGWSIMARDTDHVHGYDNDLDFAVPFIDCQFQGGSVSSVRPVINLTNCLFENVAVSLSDAGYTVDAGFRHNTFVGGTNCFDPIGGGTWTLKDNLFDGTSLYTNNSGLTHSYNAYTASLKRFQPPNVSDVVLAVTNVTYETGALGRFYLPIDSPLLNKASNTNAANIGLYHFTCTANQVKETNSQADIGFHYVATTNNVPVDTDNDCLPDYVEDANGNGIVDTGEFSWTNSVTYATNGLNDCQVWELRSNVQVNDPAQDSGSNTNTQFETTLLAFGNTVICAWVDSNLGVTGFGNKDFSGSCEWSPPLGSVSRFIGWAVSKDGGISFSDKGVPPMFTNILGATTNLLGDAGDPVLGRDTNTGIVYLLGNSPRPSTYYPDTNTALTVFAPLWRSTNNGESFLPPINVFPTVRTMNESDSLDKPAMVVDNYPGTGQGDIYVAVNWDRPNRLLINRAAQGGTNWNGTTNLVGTSASRPAFAIRPNHEACLLWVEGNGIAFAKSVDRGASFTNTMNITSFVQSGLSFDLSRYSNAAPKDHFEAHIIPSMVANPVNGDLYVVYHDRETNTLNPNVYLLQSTNGGTNWSGRIKVNSDFTTNDHWQPAITVKPDGTQLFVGWYDRRGDTASNSWIQIYGCFASTPVGTNSFTNNFLISTAQFPSVFSGTNTNANTFDHVYPPIYPLDHPEYCGTFDGNYSHHMGDYDTAFSDSRFAYVSWMDGRNTSTNGAVIRHQADIRSIKVSWPP
jgi:hypothetical protein